MEKLLTERGFSDLVAAFAEQEIDEEALQCLDPDSETLKEIVIGIIPKAGPRIKFLHKLKLYQNVMNMPVIISPSFSNENEIQTPSNSGSSESMEYNVGSPVSPTPSTSRIPGTKSTKPVNPRGKLIDKYRNLKRLYNLPKDEEVVSEENNLSNISDIDELNNSVKWLQTYQEPWELVVQNWKKTYPLRKLSNNSPTVEQYLKQWPILKHRDAPTLMQFDFEQLHPNCQIQSLLSEYQNWEKFFDSIRTISHIDKPTEEFITLLNSDISQDSENAIQIAALPMLIPPKSRIRCKKAHWKPSIVECQESLINLVSTCGNINELVENRRQKLGELSLTVQPYLVVVGVSFSAITDCYMVIDNDIYKISSVLQGLDSVFKAIHALNASYPKESEHIWLLIERLLYQIKTSDIKIPVVLTLLKDLENN